MNHFRIAACAVALLCLATGVASAQTTPAPKTNLDTTSGTLSDKLGETGGVIRPTGDVDPAMHKATPQTGTMPVIKPGQVPPQSRDGATGTGKGGLY